MKYIYVVTRIVRESEPGVTHIPNLGVHGSYKKALRHYKSVVDSRELDIPHKTTWYGDLKMQGSRPGKDKLTLMHSYFIRGEEIRMERWRM